MKPTLLVCSLDDPALDPDACRAVLAPDERARIDRIRSPAARARATVARGLLRLELARRLECAPASIELAFGPDGKPRLAHDAAWHFNVAHSGDRVVIALAQDAPIGVDVESRARRARVDALARHYYAPGERAALGALPEGPRRYRFFQLWTLKEAVTKALGRGLWGTLGGIRLDGWDGDRVELHLEAGAASDSPLAWCHFDLGADYSLGCAVLSADADEPRVFRAAPGAAARPWPARPDVAGCRVPARGTASAHSD